MSLHYQVNLEFKFKKEKPSLVSISINTTISGCTTLPVSSNYTFLKQYIVLETIKEAEYFISVIKKIYKDCKIPPIVLDSGQKYLF